MRQTREADFGGRGGWGTVTALQVSIAPVSFSLVLVLRQVFLSVTLLSNRKGMLPPQACPCGAAKQMGGVTCIGGVPHTTACSAEPV